MLRDLNQASSGRRICGIPQAGVLASQIPTGFPLAALLLDDIDAAFPNRRYRVIINTGPGGGATLAVAEDSSYVLTTLVDGVYSGGQTVEKYDDDIGLFSTEATTYSFTVGNSIASDLVVAYAVNATVSSNLPVAFIMTSSVNADLVATFVLTSQVSADLQAVYVLGVPVTIAAPSRTVQFAGGTRTVVFEGSDRTVRF